MYCDETLLTELCFQLSVELKIQLGCQQLIHDTSSLSIYSYYKISYFSYSYRCLACIKGVKAQAGRTGKAPHPRIPITPSILLKLRAVWSQGTSFNNTMLWAAATSTFFSFCRSGETTETAYDPEVHLSYSDLAADSTSAPQAISNKPDNNIQDRPV